MHTREELIRERMARVTRADSGISPEFTILSVADTEYLLGLLDDARQEAALWPSGVVVLSPSEVEEVKALLRGDTSMPREWEPGDNKLSEGLLNKFK